MFKPSKLFAIMFVIVVVCSCSNSEPTNSVWENTFEQVWSHINDNFYDEGHNGKDWVAIKVKYEPILMQSKDDEEFFVNMNSMLFELDVSHIGLIPDEHPEWIGAPSAFANGQTGIQIRVIENEIVIVAVDEELAETKPNIKTGMVIDSINGLVLSDFLDEVRQPPIAAIPEQMRLTENVSRPLFANVGEVVRLTIEGIDYEITAFERGTAIPIIEGIPPVYADFESIAVGDIGYISFNSFHRAILEDILTAIDSYRDMAGLILDLRGNVGGDFQVRRSIAEKFISKPTVIWRYRGRRGTDEIILEPSSEIFDKPLVILVDELSASSAEELSGALQSIGRATIVGSKTAGLVLVADVLRLDVGATLVFPIAETQFSNGYIPEGKGIKPDVLASWDKSSLRQGKDLALSKAVDIINQQN